MQLREPFHEGEIRVQERTGERATGVRNGAMLRDEVVPAAAAFLAQQRTVAVALRGTSSRPEVTMWLGEPGFMRAEGRLVHVDRSRAHRLDTDPLAPAAAPGAQIGLLAIELGTRRRLRINGVIRTASAAALAIDVHESFPNCPKYIQRRTLAIAPANDTIAPVVRGHALDDERCAVIERADTVFVASCHPERGLDASHRGGPPGFVRVVDERRLRFPDYPGNSMFQTLGNFELDPRAGVVFVDFQRGHLLSAMGTVETIYGQEDASHPTSGTGRYWDLIVEEWIDRGLPAKCTWGTPEPSSFNPGR